jgi:ABC-2 type transport system permease protein
MRALLIFEWHALIRDRAFTCLVLLVVAAAAFGTGNGLRSAKSQHAVIERLRADESAQLDQARAFATAIRTGATPAPRGYWANPADTRGFAHYLMTAYAVKPPLALAALTVGQSDLLPYHFKLNAGSQTKALTAYDLENPRRLRLGRFDLSFVVIFLMPLALLAAGYDALSSERDSGRFAMLMTQGLTPRRLALTRLGLRSVVIVACLLASALGTLALMGFTFSAPGVTADLRDWCLVTLAYATFWFGATLLVVASTRTSSGAALTLAGLWLALVVLMPWTLNIAARVLHPLPPRVEFVTAQRDATDAAVRDQDRLRSRFLHDHPELASSDAGSGTLSEDVTRQEAVRQYAIKQISSIEHVEAQLAPVAAGFDAQLGRQQSLVDRWQWLSPAVLAQQAFNEVSGTSAARHRAFMERVGAYIVAIRGYFNPRLLAGELEFRGFDQWPRYAWREPARAEMERRLRWALAGLLGPAVFFALAGVGLLGGVGTFHRQRLAPRAERIATS